MSKYVNSPIVSVPRYDPLQHMRVQVSCPKAIKAYNEFMGGTDKNDQLTKLQRCRRHYKWPRRLVIKFLMWSVYNSFVLHDFYVPHGRPGKKVVTFHEYVDELCHGLIGSFRRPTSIAVGRRLNIVATRLQNNGHMPEWAPNATRNNRCIVCGEIYNRFRVKNPRAQANQLPKLRKSVYRCSTCKEILCVSSSNENCFAVYHTKVEYWRWYFLLCYNSTLLLTLNQKRHALYLLKQTFSLQYMRQNLTLAIINWPKTGV